jgi:hypothetical protein
LTVFNNSKGIFVMTNHNSAAFVTDILICYSHQDIQWLSRLTATRPSSDVITKVDAVEIKAGERWLDLFKKDMQATKVALFLLSPDFLASEFGTAPEIPSLLKAAIKKGVTIQWLAISTTDSNHMLSKHKAVNNPRNPLSQFIDARQNQELAAIWEKLQETVTHWNTVQASISTQSVTDMPSDIAQILARIEKLATAAPSPKAVLEEMAAEIREMAQQFDPDDETIPSRTARSKLLPGEDLLLGIPSTNDVENLIISFGDKNSVVLGRHSGTIKEKVDIDLSGFGDGTMGISRLHAAIEKQANGDITIRDLQSTNGTWINRGSLMIDEKRKLKSGDLIRLGYLILVVMDVRSEAG